MSEKKILDKMLADSKVSNADYRLLVSTLDRRELNDSGSSLLVNPFQKIAGFKALLLGIVTILLLSYMGVLAQVYFEGILGSTIAASFKDAKMSPNFFFLLYENIISWLSLSLFFILFSYIFRQKRIRTIDFFGTVAFSRFPYLVLATSMFIVNLLRPHLTQPSSGNGLHPSIMMMLINISWSLCYVWQVSTYYYALKVSSGLMGKRLWISFLVSVVCCEMICLYLTRIFL